jgi:uncharacterized protein
MNTLAAIRSIYRYPVKGLSAEHLAATTLQPGEPLAGDRCYAIENGPSGFDPAMPRYLPKQRFLMLMKNERLARLDTHFDNPTQVLLIRENDTEVARGDLRTPAGCAAIERFFAGFCADELRGPPKVLGASGHSFSDVAKKVISIINLASVAAIEAMIGRPVDPLRFRGNLYVEGWPAWREFDLLGQEIALGTHARAKIVKRIVRCAATNVEPATGIRDLDIPPTLLRYLGHADCGVYAEVTAGGAIAAGDAVTSSLPVFSPPPCGEGPGVGILEWGTALPQPPDPPPRPSPRRNRVYGGSGHAMKRSKSATADFDWVEEEETAASYAIALPNTGSHKQRSAAGGP